MTKPRIPSQKFHSLIIICPLDFKEECIKAVQEGKDFEMNNLYFCIILVDLN